MCFVPFLSPSHPPVCSLPLLFSLHLETCQYFWCKRRIALDVLILRSGHSPWCAAGLTRTSLWRSVGAGGICGSERSLRLSGLAEHVHLVRESLAPPQASGCPLLSPRALGAAWSPPRGEGLGPPQREELHCNLFYKLGC